MKSKLNRKLQIGYGFSVLILLAIGIISYTTIQTLLSSDKLVAHSNVVIEKLEKTISIMTNAETGQRGFLLTNKKAFLDPYNGSYEKAVALVNQVKWLTRDNPAQQQNLDALKQILLKRLNVLQELIDKKQAEKAIATEDLTQGKTAMDALRSAVDKAESDEKKLLEQRTEVLNKYAFLTPLIIAAAVVLALLIAVLSYLKVISDVAEKDRLNWELALKEQETAAFNEELAAANEELAATNEEYVASNEELHESRQQLEDLNNELEEKVSVRTKALAESEADTQALNEELNATNEELAAANEEMVTTNEELLESQQTLQKTFDELSLAKDQIEKSEKLFKSIAVNIPKSLIIIIGKDHRFLAVEGDLMTRMGYDGRDYTGKHPAEVAPPERYEATKHLYERVLAGEQFTTERKGSTGDDFRVDFVPLKNETGEVYAGLIIALEITDVKKAEERSAKLAAIVETSDDAIISKTLDGIITSWNTAAERMFGYPEAEIIGASILKLIPEDRHSEEPSIIARIKAGERVDHFETKRLTRENNLIDVSLTISPMMDARGNITGISKIARDISEKKQDEIRKNDFIGMVSHELKTPLTSLTAIIQMVNSKLKNSGDAFLFGAMEKANVQAKKMGTMINGFLNVSRLESGKMLIDKQLFNLGEVIAEIVEEIQLTVSGHQILFDTCSPIMINADRDKIGSVISNLLTNAVKYSPKGKVVYVNCEVLENEVQVSVKDEGMGIKTADLENLFDRYYRVESNHTRHISGFGIGLYLSAEIIQHHDGRIWVESESGVGSTFHFSLPVAG